MCVYITTTIPPPLQTPWPLASIMAAASSYLQLSPESVRVNTAAAAPLLRGPRSVRQTAVGGRGGGLQVGRCFGGGEGGEGKQESFRCNFTFCSSPRVHHSHRPCGHRPGVPVCLRQELTLPPFNFAAVQSVDDAAEYREQLFDSSSWNLSQNHRHQQKPLQEASEPFPDEPQPGFQFTLSGSWSE